MSGGTRYLVFSNIGNLDYNAFSQITGILLVFFYIIIIAFYNLCSNIGNYYLYVNIFNIIIIYNNNNDL